MGVNICYLWAEVTGRKNRSLLMIGGLALGVALWICLYLLAGAHEEAAVIPLRQLGIDLPVFTMHGL